MNKQTGAIVVSILFAVGTAAASYAADTTKPVKGSEADAATAAQPMTPSDPLKVKEGTNVAPEGGIPQEKVTGELVKIDGKNYVVKDEKGGKEVRFMIDERTHMNANPKVGDKIRVKVEPQGYAYSVNMASDAPGASLPDKQSDPLAKSDPKSIKK